MSAAVIYARISKDDQGDALGVDRQEKLCRKLARDRGLDVVDVLIDNDVSAMSRKRRPAFEALVDRLKAGDANAVVCYHVDRLYRRTTDLERLVELVEATGAHVHTVAAGDIDLGTASGRMIARMLGAAAQHESERLGERMMAKHDERAAAGAAPGGRTPFGYRRAIAPDGRARGPYLVDELEAATVRRMASRVLEGASLLRVARELDAAGIATREGRPWHHSSVRATLVNPAVAGLRVHRREIAGPGEWQPVLDRATWEQVRAVLADPARKRTRPPRKFLLAGLVQNPNGDPMNGATITADGERRVYSTRIVKDRPKPSPSMSIGADELEEFVVEAVLQLLDERALPVSSADAPASDVTDIEAELAELAELRGGGAISLAEWMAARTPLQRRLEDARAAARSVRRPTATTRLLGKRGAARKAWPALDLSAQHELLEAVIERVVVAPATRGRWTPIEERLGYRIIGGVAKSLRDGAGIVWRP